MQQIVGVYIAVGLIFFIVQRVDFNKRLQRYLNKNDLGKAVQIK